MIKTPNIYSDHKSKFESHGHYVIDTVDRHTSLQLIYLPHPESSRIDANSTLVFALLL